MNRKTLYEVLNGAMNDGTERAIHPGDYVLVEEGPVPLEAGAVYLVAAQEGLHLREARWAGRWFFAPWSPAHAAFPLEAVRVVGRVRRVARFTPLG